MDNKIGDILTPNMTNRGVIVCHQVNCKGVMGAGLAKQIRDKYPDVYSMYKEHCRQIANGNGGLGDVQFCSVLERSGYIVANVFGQDDYGRGQQHTNYCALRRAFTIIAESFPGYIIRIPYKMGCGLGGGDWKTVYSIIHTTLIAAGIEVEIWQLPEQ